MSRFPKISETFVLDELLAVEEHGVRVELYPLIRHEEPIVHPEAIPLVARARYFPFMSRAVLVSQVAMLRQRPVSYLAALFTVVGGLIGDLPTLARTLTIFPKVVHAARDMQSRGISHVHCHFANHPTTAGLMIHRLTGIPFSFTAHAFDIHLNTRLLAAKTEEAAFVVAISNEGRQILLDTARTNASGKVHLLHCGVDTRRFPKRPRPVAEELRILAVGRLIEMKGHTHLIDALQILRDEGVSVTCRLVGDGPLRTVLTQQVEQAGLSSVVQLLGARTHGEVSELMADSHILAQPSIIAADGRREGIPVVLMEAMCSGLPVVATRHPGIEELVHDEETGLLVTPGDAPSLAHALKRLHVDQRLTSRIVGSAALRIREDFDLHASARWLSTAFRNGTAP